MSAHDRGPPSSSRLAPAAAAAAAHGRWARGVAGALLALAAGLHVLGVVGARVSTDEPAWRHALFAVIDAAAAVGFFVGTRSLAFAVAFAALTLQQIWSHGGDVARTWRDTGRLDVASAAVVLFMPLASAWLLATARRKPRSADIG